MTDLFPSRKTKTLQLWSPSLSWHGSLDCASLRREDWIFWQEDQDMKGHAIEGEWAQLSGWGERVLGRSQLRGPPLQMLSQFIDMIFSNICFQWLPSAWATHMPAYTMQLISTCALYQYLHRLLAHHRETARIKQGHMTSPAMVWKPKFAVIQHILHWHTEQVVAPSDSAYPHSSYSFATPPAFVGKLWQTMRHMATPQKSHCGCQENICSNKNNIKLAGKWHCQG